MSAGSAGRQCGQAKRNNSEAMPTDKACRLPRFDDGSSPNTKSPDTAGACAVIELSPAHAGPAGRGLDTQGFVRLRESDPTALAVEAATHQFLPGQSHHFDFAAMDGDVEAGVEGLGVSGKHRGLAGGAGT